MKTLILCHKSKSDAGALEDMLRARGADIDLHLAFDEGVRGIDAGHHDLTIFMGGPMGAYQNDLFPYLDEEIDYIKRRIDLGKPYLGVCLGGQLLAKAMGADNFPGKAGKEIGWHNINVNEAGMKTPLRHLDQSFTKMMQWHGDTFTLPKEVTLLASSPLYENQAFAYENALGFQFHPEVTNKNIELWLALGQAELQQVGLNVKLLREQTLENLNTLNKQRTMFFNEWIESVL